MPKVSVWLQVDGDIDTLMLWSLIEHLNLNLTAIDGITWIYGDVAPHKLGELISRCVLFGRVEAKFGKGGVVDEKEPKT